MTLTGTLMGDGTVDFRICLPPRVCPVPGTAGTEAGRTSKQDH